MSCYGFSNNHPTPTTGYPQITKNGINLWLLTNISILLRLSWNWRRTATWRLSCVNSSLLEPVRWRCRARLPSFSPSHPLSSVPTRRSRPAWWGNWRRSSVASMLSSLLRWVLMLLSLQGVQQLGKSRPPKSGKSLGVFTRGQFWPSGIVIGCVCGSVCPCVCVSITRLSAR